MKTLFIFIASLFFSLTLFAQQIQTDVVATVNVDDFTGNMTITTETWRNIAVDQTRNRLSASLASVREGIFAIRLRYSGDLGCLSQNRSTLLVRLENDEIIEFTQVSRTDCSSRGGQSGIFWPITSNELKGVSEIEELIAISEERIDILYSYDWVSMRLRGSRYRTDLEVNPTRQIPHPEQFFRHHIQAIRNAYAGH